MSSNQAEVNQANHRSLKPSKAGSYLQRLSVAVNKIDGVFVIDMDTNELNRIFIETLV